MHRIASAPPASLLSAASSSASLSSTSESTASGGSAPPPYAALAAMRDAEALHLRSDPHSAFLAETGTRAMLRRAQDNADRGYELERFLASDDAGARMPADRREVLRKRCLLAADAHYLEDQWPDVGTGRQSYPKDRLLPAFTKHHWEITATRTTLLDQLAEEVSSYAWKNLAIFAAPLRIELDQLKQRLGPSGVPPVPPCVAKAERLLKWIDMRPDASPPGDCWINREVRDIDEARSELQRAARAATGLRLALTGFKSVHGDTPFFNAQNYPAYHQQWLRALESLEQEDWPTFSTQVKALRAERSRLLAELPLPTSSEC